LQNKKWLAILALSISYPSSIFIIWLLAYKLTESDVVPKFVAFGGAFIMTVSMLSIIVLKSFKK
jgi:hypothetical protein